MFIGTLDYANYMEQKRRPKTGARVLDATYEIVEKRGGIGDIREVYDTVVNRRVWSNIRNKDSQMCFADFVQKIQKSRIMRYEDGFIVNKDLQEEATKYLSYTHPRTKRSRLPKLLLKEVERLEQQRSE